MSTVRIDVWSDIACPWCYIGKRRLEAALSTVASRDAIEVHWRAFELNPAEARESSSGSYAERLAKKYGKTVTEAEAMIDRVTQIAQLDGLAFDYALIKPGNTFDAHRLVQAAKLHGSQDAMEERLFRGYFCEGAAIGSREELHRLAVDAGLPENVATAVLDSDAHGEAVREDERAARELGISGVPFFLFGGSFAVSGAQPADVLRDALERACGGGDGA